MDNELENKVSQEESVLDTQPDCMSGTMVWVPDLPSTMV